MPIDLPDLQRRSVPLGEIRIGTSVPGKNGGRQPKRSETFIFTTDEYAAEVVAAKYGGSVSPWDRRKGRFIVTTGRNLLHVWVPPRGLAVDANMELWDGGKCKRRCTGTRMLPPFTGPCLCPQPDDPYDPDSVQRAREERKRLAAQRQACKPLTRINVSITDLPGLTGVWRLNTGSENAAVETADQGDALAIAREAGAYLPAVLRIDWRVRAADGSPYPVPVLRIGMSAEDLARGALPPGPGGLLRQLRAGTGEIPAITAGDGPQPPAEERPEAGRGNPLHYETADINAAQRYADLTDRAATSAEVEALKEKAVGEGVDLEDQICTGPERDVFDKTLREYMQNRWRELHAVERGVAGLRQAALDDNPDDWPQEETA